MPKKSASPPSKELIGLAVTVEDGKWWYAVPKNQNIKDGWEKCNCTWMHPEASVPPHFRHPDYPDTPMRWFRHVESLVSPVFSYARFGIVTFVGTSDPNNDPMTTRFVWGVPSENDDEMESLYHTFVAREAEESRQRADELRKIAATETPSVPQESEVPRMEAAPDFSMWKGKYVVVEARRLYYVPDTAEIESVGEDVTFTNVHRAFEMSAGDAVPSNTYFVVKSQPCDFTCSLNDLVEATASASEKWASGHDHQLHILHFNSAPLNSEISKAKQGPVKRQRSDTKEQSEEDQSIAAMALTREAMPPVRTSASVARRANRMRSSDGKRKEVSDASRKDGALADGVAANGGDMDAMLQELSAAIRAAEQQKDLLKHVRK